MLTSQQDEQDERDLSQSYEAGIESIGSASCVLSKQPQVNTSKLTFYMFKKANKLGQEAILYWCYFIEKYDKRIDNLVSGGVKKKTATSMIYQEIKQLLPGITDVNLRQKILRARKLFKLFNTLGLEKISQVSYSANAISSLNYQQIQN
ncbi:15716_t:CDS:2, partial [Funneliformis geosporum]